jgi:hypothetical protein
MGRLAIKRSGQFTYLPDLARRRAFAKSVIGTSTSAIGETPRCETRAGSLARTVGGADEPVGRKGGGSGLRFDRSAPNPAPKRQDGSLGRRRKPRWRAKRAQISSPAEIGGEPVVSMSKAHVRKSASLATKFDDVARLDRLARRGKRRRQATGAAPGFRLLLGGKRPSRRPLTFERFSPVNTVTI